MSVERPTMRFPSRKYDAVGAFADAYFETYGRAAASVDRAKLVEAARAIEAAYRSDRWLFVCGNGGSAAISNHWLCDHMKGVATDTKLRPRVVSLSANLEMITAIANDLAYDDVFVYQLKSYARPGDVLLTVSSSGNSENVVRAVQWARDNGLRTVAMTGFDGGRAQKLAEIGLHVAADNYGVVEDVHQSLMHVLAQFLRQGHMSAELIAVRKF
jgi:phosphoheptose isomerase